MKLWRPDSKRVANSYIKKFENRIKEKFDVRLSSYEDLWQWSIKNKVTFWKEIIHFTELKTIDTKGPSFIQHANFYESQFFPDYTLNYSQNLLENFDKNQSPLIFRSENKYREEWSYQDVFLAVSSLAVYFQEIGLKKGDRIVAYMPNIPETIIAFLACASIGCIWASCSPDFGIQGVLDRFSQIKPKLFIACGEYSYNGKDIDVRDKIKQIVKKLPTLTNKLIFSYPNKQYLPIKSFANGNEILRKYSANTIEYQKVLFNHPLYILFSSGTTGIPKCIVHSTGGALIQHLKELKLHCDIQKGDKVFYFTTCGWMMWNWIISAMACQATICLYDGFPFHNNTGTLFDYVATEKIHFMGLGAKIIDVYRNKKLEIKKKYDLTCLKTITSTASPLVPESFEYVYANIKEDLHLASISGGTDIVSCFVLGNPTLPVYRGEIQCAGLGMDVDVVDNNGISTKAKGELVCKAPFPSKPVFFWNDANHTKFRNSYFAKNSSMWMHGDYIQRTNNNGFIIYGRSDTTLNPGGVRIGTAEIYRYVETIPEVEEAIVIGQNWKNDVRIVLFVVLASHKKLDDKLRHTIKHTIIKNASPKHAPAKIIAVKEIPRTRSGKITEIAVKKAVQGEPIENIEAIANSDCLKYYQNIPELQSN